MTDYRGSCHCGAVRFEIRAEVAELVTCNCSLCRKRNAVMAMVHESRFTLLQGQDELVLYRWNSKVAKHYFCSVCGIYCFHRRRSAPDNFAVNFFCLEGLAEAQIPRVAVDGQAFATVDGCSKPS